MTKITNGKIYILEFEICDLFGVCYLGFVI